jgi:hypothetical protein
MESLGVDADTFLVGERSASNFGGVFGVSACVGALDGGPGASSSWSCAESILLVCEARSSGSPDKLALPVMLCFGADAIASSCGGSSRKARCWDALLAATRLPASASPDAAGSVIALSKQLEEWSKFGPSPAMRRRSPDLLRGTTVTAARSDSSSIPGVSRALTAGNGEFSWKIESSS